MISSRPQRQSGGTRGASNGSVWVRRLTRQDKATGAGARELQDGISATSGYMALNSGSLRRSKWSGIEAAADGV
jgi:hypothetical protein